jgi:hypothetical protein
MDRRLAFSLPLALAGLLAASGCATLDIHAEGPLAPRSGWVLLPVQNLGEAPLAGERVEELLTTLLRTQKGIELARAPASAALPAAGSEAAVVEPDERERYERSLAWARGQKLSYGVGGSVEEWRYRSASDGEPAVAVTVRVVDLKQGKVVYSASGSAAGWGRATLSGTAQRLLRTLVGRIPVGGE